MAIRKDSMQGGESRGAAKRPNYFLLFGMHQHGKQRSFEPPFLSHSTPIFRLELTFSQAGRTRSRTFRLHMVDFTRTCSHSQGRASSRPPPIHGVRLPRKYNKATRGRRRGRRPLGHAPAGRMPDDGRTPCSSRALSCVKP